MVKNAAEKKTILVLERSQKDRAHLSDLLSRYGYLAEEEDSPERCLERIREGGVDLLMAGVGMSPGGGSSLIREIRSQPPGADVPVIVLATKEDLDDAARWLASGCNDFLLKPVNPRLLFQRVQALVESHPRAYRRVSCHAVAEGTTGAEGVMGELREIGEGGAGLLLDQQLAVNDILKLHFSLPRRPGGLTVGAAIIYVRETPEGYHHGLRFIIIDDGTRNRIKDFVQDALLQDA